MAAHVSFNLYKEIWDACQTKFFLFSCLYISFSLIGIRLHSFGEKYAIIVSVRINLNMILIRNKYITSNFKILHFFSNSITEFPS